MGAIAPHKTAIDDGPWDAAKNERNLKTGQDESYYKKAYAWQDPEADPTTKSAYKFIHHIVDSDGNIGAANIKACQSTIGVLNGAMGGADIPDADRKGVYNHVAKHLRDAKLEPAELKSKGGKVQKEYRMMEIRAAQLPADSPENTDMIVEGRAVVYNQPTVLFEIDGIEYREVIDAGALDGADLSDVPFKYNHSDDVMIMARTRNKTLELIVDDQGLFVRAHLANTTAGRDLYTLIKRGDIDKMSFAFTVAEEEYDRNNRTRHIKKIDKVWDVSGVDIPAYDTTTLSARSYFELEREKERKLESLNRRKQALKTSIEIINLIYGGNIDE